MTTTDGFEWPQNDPLFDLSLSLIAEGIAGVGVLSTGDFQVTATANGNEIQVNTGTLFYGGSTYSIGTAETHTLSANSSGSDRWDLVYFDTTLSTPASAVREGTASADPEPPALQTGEYGIAYIYVADGETDVPDTVIKNWRTFASRSDETYIPDSGTLYGGETVESALQTELQYAAQLTGYPLPIGDLNSPYGLPDITDMDAAGTDLSDSVGPGVIYDASAGEVLQGVLGGPASSLTSYPLPNGDLNNDTITVSAGTNLSGGGSVALGGSTTVNYSPGELGLPNHHTEYTGGLADEEIARFQIPTGRVLEVYQLNLELKGGGSDTALDVDVYDETNATEIASTTAGTLAYGTPLGTSGAGATITVRLTTGNSGPYTINAGGITNIRDQ